MKQNPAEFRQKPRSPKTSLFVLAGCAIGLLIIASADIHPLRWLRLHEYEPALERRNTPQIAPPAPMSIVQPTPTGNDSSLSAVPQRLHLTAVRLGRNANEGYADIGVNPKSPQTYRAGALLANGARLHELYRDHVVLVKNGSTVELYVDGAEPLTQSQRGAGGNSPLAWVGGSGGQIMATASVSDPFGKLFRVSPRYDGDAFEGVQLYPPSDARAFYKAGLRDGDVVTEIDGERPSSPEAAMRKLRSLTSGQAIQVTVVRADATVQLLLDGRLMH